MLFVPCNYEKNQEEEMKPFFFISSFSLLNIMKGNALDKIASNKSQHVNK